MKAAVILTDGIEEAECVTIIDFLRRADIECVSYGLDSKEIKGMQNIRFFADQILDDSIMNCDMIIVPGGRESIKRFKKDQRQRVKKWLQAFEDEKKWIAAMCSGTQMLEESNVIKGRRVTGYTGYEDCLKSGIFTGQVVERDENLITSQGPATAYPFAFALIEAAGIDTSELRHRLMYTFANGWRP